MSQRLQALCDCRDIVMRAYQNLALHAKDRELLNECLIPIQKMIDETAGRTKEETSDD